MYVNTWKAAYLGCIHHSILSLNCLSDILGFFIWQIFNSHLFHYSEAPLSSYLTSWDTVFHYLTSLGTTISPPEAPPCLALALPHWERLASTLALVYTMLFNTAYTSKNQKTQKPKNTKQKTSYLYGNLIHCSLSHYHWLTATVTITDSLPLSLSLAGAATLALY